MSWVSNSSSVKSPSLVGSFMTVPEDDMSVVDILSTMNIEALLTVVSNVHVPSTIVDNPLIDLSSVWSDDSRLTDSVTVSFSVSNGVGSLLS